MDLLCYLHDGWQPLIRPAEPTRAWMDATPAAFAYRCLPLNIANAHGWEILTPAGFSAYWRGGSDTGEVIIRPDKGMQAAAVPVSLFGQGTLTIHVQGLFRTPPGWNLFVSGSPNSAKDGIAALSGVIETDWSPYTFTLNWRFTRRNHWVRFEAGEPVGFIQPTLREALERMEPKLVPLADNPEAARQFTAWSQSRTAFQAEVARDAPVTGAEQWQKRYYRGLDMDGRQGAADHQAKLRLKPFTAGTPEEATTQTLQLDVERLGVALGELAASLRDGTGFEADRLAAAGLPQALAERLLRSARAQLAEPV